nr:biotin/lipoyl-containing protein [Cellulomonas hominis]
MPSYQQFRLPDAGEGLTEAEIAAWHVAVGDTVAINQTIVEIETAKSLVDLPSPYAGVVTRLLVAEGETVEVGTPIIEIDTDPSGEAPAGGTPGAVGAGPEVEVSGPTSDADPVAAAAPSGAPGAAAPADEEAGGAVLVGYGTASAPTRRRARFTSAEGDPVAGAAGPDSSAGAVEVRPVTAPPAAARQRPRPREASGAQARPGPRRGPRLRAAHRPRRHRHPRGRAGPAGERRAPHPGDLRR